MKNIKMIILLLVCFVCVVNTYINVSTTKSLSNLALENVVALASVENGEDCDPSLGTYYDLITYRCEYDANVIKPGLAYLYPCEIKIPESIKDGTYHIVIEDAEVVCYISNSCMTSYDRCTDVSCEEAWVDSCE